MYTCGQTRTGGTGDPLGILLLMDDFSIGRKNRIDCCDIITRTERSTRVEKKEKIRIKKSIRYYRRTQRPRNTTRFMCNNNEKKKKYT